MDKWRNGLPCFRSHLEKIGQALRLLKPYYVSYLPDVTDSCEDHFRHKLAALFGSTSPMTKKAHQRLISNGLFIAPLGQAARESVQSVRKSLAIEDPLP